MRSWERHLCLLFALFAVAPAEDDWDYREKGPFTWCNIYETCGGNLQSPIMLNTRSIVRVDDHNVHFHNYGTVATGNFTNNGHTVNLDFNLTDIKKHPRVSIASSRASSEYYLRGLHFHWQSEHWIDYVRYPLEMHMVHKDSTDKRILVIGYVFMRCKVGTSNMDQVTFGVQQLKEVGDSLNFVFAPKNVMPSNPRACGYFAYEGSLTTPPCTEGVTWLVRQEPMCIEDRQLEAFYNVHEAHGLPMTGNARTLQPVNKRTVYFHTC